MTHDDLKAMVRYDPETGLFFWIERKKGRRIGRIAGHSTPNGYWSLGIHGKSYLAHRLAWLYVHGTFPAGVIDHINGNRLDNRIGNLRDVTQVENMINVHAPRKDNTSGFRGVSWHSQKNKWTARLFVGNKYLSLGLHKTPEDAHAAYESAKRLHGLLPT